MTDQTEFILDASVPNPPHGALHVQHLRAGGLYTVVVAAIDALARVVEERRGSIALPADLAASNAPAILEATLKRDVLAALELCVN